MPASTHPLTLLSPPQDWRHILGPGDPQGGESNIHKQSQGRESYSPRGPRGQRLSRCAWSHFQDCLLSSGVLAGDCALWLCALQIHLRLGRSFPEVSKSRSQDPLGKQETEQSEQMISGGRQGSAR